MHRETLLGLLKKYPPKDLLEETLKTQFIDFVLGHANCFERTLKIGHVTASAWLLNHTGDSVLLTHHKKLGKWLQLGGHCDGMPDIFEAAIKEAQEESGLENIRVLKREIFDLDIHPIPERPDEPKHYHFDVRVVLQASGEQKFKVSAESKELAWVRFDQIPKYTQEDSILRMMSKKV